MVSTSHVVPTLCPCCLYIPVLMLSPCWSPCCPHLVCTSLWSPYCPHGWSPHPCGPHVVPNVVSTLSSCCLHVVPTWSPHQPLWSPCCLHIVLMLSPCGLHIPVVPTWFPCFVSMVIPMVVSTSLDGPHIVPILGLHMVLMLSPWSSPHPSGPHIVHMVVSMVVSMLLWVKWSAHPRVSPC